MCALVLEIKARREGAGFTLIKRWLGDYDGLVMREDRAEPMVTLTWQAALRLLRAAVRSTSTQPRPNVTPVDVISAKRGPKRQQRGEDDVPTVES